MTTKLEIVESENSPLPKGFLAHLPEIFDREGETIYKGRNEIKNFTVDGRTVCVKRYSIPPFLNRILYSCGLRTCKAKCTYDNAREIARRGFQTPQQWGYIVARGNGLIAQSYSVGEFLEGMHTVAQDKTDEKLLRAFAQYTADLHAKGLMHRDYILNNVLYACAEDKFIFWLIDINRFRFSDQPVHGLMQRLNLMQLLHEPAELERFVRMYQEAAHMPDGLSKQVLFLRRWRTRWSTFKHQFLKKIPGVQWLTKHGK